MPVTTRSKSGSIKLDFSKMPKKALSTPFVIAKSTEQQLEDVLAEIEVLKKELAIQMHYSRMDLKDLHDALVMIDALTKENDALKAK